MNARLVSGAVSALALSSFALLPLVACSGDDTTATPDASSPTPTATPTSTPTTPPTSSSVPDAAPAPDAADAQPATIDVTLAFAAKVGAAAWSCTATYPTMGTTPVTVEPKDFRFFVSSVRLVKKDGTKVALTLPDDGKWQAKGVALLDFEDGTGTCTDGNTEVNTQIKGKAPAGEYVGLAFDVGIPFAENHLNPATQPSPLNSTQMLWSWLGGFRFIKIDVQPKDTAGGVLPRFNLHLGSTDCVGDPANGTAVTSCARPNRVPVELAAFDATKQKVVVDIAPLLAGELTQNAGGPPGCMSGKTDPECSPVFPKLGLDFTTGMPSGTQSVFKAE